MCTAGGWEASALDAESRLLLCSLQERAAARDNAAPEVSPSIGEAEQLEGAEQDLVRGDGTDASDGRDSRESAAVQAVEAAEAVEEMEAAEEMEATKILEQLRANVQSWKSDILRTQDILDRHGANAQSAEQAARDADSLLERLALNRSELADGRDGDDADDVDRCADRVDPEASAELDAAQQESEAIAADVRVPPVQIRISAPVEDGVPDAAPGDVHTYQCWSSEVVPRTRRPDCSGKFATGQQELCSANCVEQIDSEFSVGLNTPGQQELHGTSMLDILDDIDALD